MLQDRELPLVLMHQLLLEVEQPVKILPEHKCLQSLLATAIIPRDQVRVLPVRIVRLRDRPLAEEGAVLVEEVVVAGVEETKRSLFLKTINLIENEKTVLHSVLFYPNATSCSTNIQ